MDILQANTFALELSLHDAGATGGTCCCSACSYADGDKIAQGGSAPPQTVDSVAASTTTTANGTLGGYITGTIDTAGDHDWYRVVLIQGQTYTFTTILSGGLSDSVLALRNFAGTLIVENDDIITGGSQTFSEITFTATADGVYYLDVSGYGSATGEFQLTATKPAFDGVGHTSATTATLAIGAAVNGTFESAGDHDWYAVQLTAGQSYLFTTELAAGGNVDTVLYVRDGSGNPLAFNDDGGTGQFSKIRFVAPTTGTYYIDAGVWGNAQAGSYRLAAAVAPPLEVFTYDQIATQLTTTYWDGASRHFNVAPGGTITVNITALTAEGQFLAREALNMWSDVTGITFSEVATGGQIDFDDNESGAFSTSSVGTYIISSHVNVSTDWLASSGTTLRSYSFQTYVHEIGHALGLGHAGPYNSTADYALDASYLNDAWATTVMSYFSQTENTYFSGQGFTRQFAVTPMVADIVAVASLYGTASTTRTGDTTYGFNNTSGRAVYDAAVGQTAVSFTIVDHGGTDTVDYSGYSSNARIDLNPETFSNVGNRVGNMTIARGTIIENAITGSGADVLIGNAADNRLTGGLGNDSLDGGSSVDTAVVLGNRSAYTVTQTSTGNFTVVGPDGTDTLVNIEYLQFSDQTLRLLPGTGTAVDFNASPASYMGSIRDFGGNDLGGAGGWSHIGTADVDGDGDIDHILVNQTIGRFAEVATAPDGLVYFSDHSWAGETRVVGIYIDPLVQANPALSGGPFDSQARFQNDLLIGNINGVLGGGDYDHDGLQEVYFRLTDGTAYLHAYMHADGNIRYANYQNQQQVIDFLTTNGWAPSTYAGWFPAAAEAPATDPKGAETLAASLIDFGLDAQFAFEAPSALPRDYWTFEADRGHFDQPPFASDTLVRWTEDYPAMLPIA